MDLYELLDVTKDVTEGELKTAYRNKSKSCHPDIGGSAETFKQICEAYKILSDKEKRARYDSGESFESISKAHVSEELLIKRSLIELFTQIVASVDPNFVNIIDQMKARLRNNSAQIQQSINNENTRMKRLESAMQRLNRTEGEDFFSLSAEAQINHTKNVIRDLEAKKELTQKGITMLEEFTYKTDERPGLHDFFGAGTTFAYTSGI